jgi:hypothetical protein
MKPMKILVLAAVVLVGCKTEISNNNIAGKVNFVVSHRMNGAPLVLNAPFSTPLGEPFIPLALSYYISNIKLVDLDGKIISQGANYFLVDERKPLSKSFVAALPVGTYKAIKFTLGVDSIRNVSGIQAGALDPANGMFWSWNTGYIFAKLEGKSVVSTAPLSNVTYHIGGFRTGENALQEVTLNLPEPLLVKTSGKATLRLEADVAKWFSGRHQISIAKNAFCMDPGPLAQQIAENYAGMFTVTAVENQ